MSPVGVSGDINRLVCTMIRSFNAAHRDVQAEAIYAGSDDNTEQKVMPALGVGSGETVRRDLQAAWACVRLVVAQEAGEGRAARQFQLSQISIFLALY